MPDNHSQHYRIKQGYFPGDDTRIQSRSISGKRAAKTQRRPLPLLPILSAVAVVALIVAAVIFAPRLFAATAPVSWSTADLFGQWATDAQEGTAFVAEVKANSITINWSTEDANALYWSGSFSVPSGPENIKTVVSAAAPENQTALLASTDSEKIFSVSKNQISFDVSMMGITRRFTLRRP